jgi:hypothetical protein
VDPVRLENGNLLIPRRAEAGGVVGDAVVEIGPDDPEYREWEKYFKDTKAAPTVEGSPEDLDERAGLIADIMLGLSGDDAMGLLFPEGEKPAK